MWIMCIFSKAVTIEKLYKIKGNNLDLKLLIEIKQS